MASGQVDPISNPQAWSSVEIAGTECPGVCIVGEFARKSDWDKKKGKGANGATLTYTGRPPAEGEIEFLAWLPTHFVEWERFRPLLKYDALKKNGADAAAVDIWHPALADLGINSVVVEEMTSWVHKGGGLYSLKVKFVEYNPPPAQSAVVTPPGAIAAGPGAPGQTPLTTDDAYQKQIAALLAQASAP